MATTRTVLTRQCDLLLGLVPSIGMCMLLPGIVVVSSHLLHISDSPYPLIVAALQAVPALTGTEETGFDFTIFTGDLIPHDPANKLSR